MDLDSDVLCNGTCSGSEISVEEVARTFSDLLKIPTITRAHFEDEDENLLIISTEWRLSDVVKKEKSTFVKTITVLKNSIDSGNGNPAVYESSPLPDNTT